MIHSIETIAGSRFLDTETAKQVAETSKHTLKDDAGFFVSTWGVDAFVAEVIVAQGGRDASNAIREREIEKHRSRYHQV